MVLISAKAVTPKGPQYSIGVTRWVGASVSRVPKQSICGPSSVCEALSLRDPDYEMAFSRCKEPSEASVVSKPMWPLLKVRDLAKVRSHDP